MSDDCIAEILLSELDTLYKLYIFYRDFGNNSLCVIYSEKMSTVKVLAASFGVWNKVKPIVDDRYKI